MKSCGKCCVDKHKDCKAYATEYNYCDNNLYKAWMHENCANSCGTCKGR